ncbi:MAG: hypothetical protein ABJB05_14770 [Parafilimonas sp.]
MAGSKTDNHRQKKNGVSYSLKIQSEAVLDIHEAFEWYEKQNEGLGFFLMEEIENCYTKLAGHPL